MKNLNVGDKVWHPKTKLVGLVFGLGDNGDVMKGGERIPASHAGVVIEDQVTGDSNYYIWTVESLELLDEEEYKAVQDLVKAKKLKTELNKAIEEAKTEYGRAEEALLAFLDRMATRGTRHYAGVGQITIDGVEVHASISEENKELAFQAIEKMGRGEVIKRTIHPKTLDSFVSELKDTGVPVPPEITVFEKPKLSFAKKK